MEENWINEFATNVTIISSIVAIAAVSVCSILSALINQIGAKKSKQSELLFHEMISAYYDYLRASGEFSDVQDLVQITRYQDAFTRASLFASKTTKSILNQHKEDVTRTLIAKSCKDKKLYELATQSSKTEEALVRSMQKDLRK